MFEDTFELRKLWPCVSQTGLRLSQE